MGRVEYGTDGYPYKLSMSTGIENTEQYPTVEAIPKAEYEARLKADMVAMLTDIQLELEELKYLDGEEPINITQDYLDELKSWDYGKKDCIKIIQQKIDALKAESEG